MSLTIFRETFGKARQRYSAVRNNEAVRDHVLDVTDAIQSVVDTFRAPDGGRYIVALGSGVNAYTTVEGRRIVVTHDPIFDKSLTIAEACTVMTGLVLHEIGHTLYTFPIIADFEAAFGKREADQWGYVDGQYQTIRANYDRLAYHIWNIADDARLERRMAERLPVASDVFPSMLQWVARHSGMDQYRGKWDATAPMKNRVDVALFALRFPWVATWSADPITRAERLWWREWRERYVTIADDDAQGVIAAIREALDRLRSPEREPIADDQSGQGEGDDLDEPKPETDDVNDDDAEGEGDDDWSDEDDDEDGEPGEGKWSDDEADEDEDGEGEGEGESDEGEPGDEADADAGSGEGEGDEAEDGESNGQSSDTPPDDWADEDGEGDEPGESSQPGGEPSDEPTDQPGEGKVDQTPVEVNNEPGEPGEGDGPTEVPNLTSHPDDFDPNRDANKSLDDINRGTDWKHRREGETLQRMVDEAKTLTRVDFGKHGKARIEVNMM